MKSFRLSLGADHDLDLILAYLETIPATPAQTIAASIRKALRSISTFPFRGAIQSELTRLAGVDVRSVLVHSYRIIYKIESDAPEIIGVLHTSRDIANIISSRLQ